MHFYQTNARRPKTLSKIFARARCTLRASMCAMLFVTGCGNVKDPVELKPQAWAPPATDREWTPNPASRNLVGTATQAAALSDLPAQDRQRPLGLAELIGIALSQNPVSRAAWESAQAMAAAAGAARAPFYPNVSVESVNGYQRLVDLVPKHWGTLKTWQNRSMVSLDYDLIDFGRRDSRAKQALNQMIGANLLFNRKVQQVVFDVERAFYQLDAAQAGVEAARATLKLARSDLTDAERRQHYGLATKPAVLLAGQREAQAEYDLENARLAVSLAQADLALALGVRADRVPEVGPLEAQPLPKSLGEDVDRLIDAALRDRPDLAAEVSTLRARQAAVEFAHASLYPTFALTSFYGEQGFTYRLSNPPTPTYTALAPEYGAGVTLKWELFTGFSRINSIRQATDERDQARADLTSAELDVAADVWRAYYSYMTAKR
jgi:outer membrane protein